MKLFFVLIVLFYPILACDAQTRYYNSKVTLSNNCKMDSFRPPKYFTNMQNKGEVFVQVFVDEDGYVADVAILQSSGDSLLDLATQVGFSNCKYLPIYKEGKPTKFSLQDSYNWQQRVEASKNQMGMGVEFKFTDSQLEIGCVQSITDRCFIRLYDKKCYMPSRSKDFNSLCNAPQHEFILNVGQKEKISSASELGLPCASEQKYKSLDECIDRK